MICTTSSEKISETKETKMLVHILWLSKMYIFDFQSKSYQPHVAKSAPVTKKWNSNTEMTTKAAWPALWSYL